MAYDTSELARQLAARRKLKQVTCPICGTQVVGIGRRTYCGDRCSKLAWWRRHRAKTSDASEEVDVLAVRDDDGGTGEAEHHDRRRAAPPSE